MRAPAVVVHLNVAKVLAIGGIILIGWKAIDTLSKQSPEERAKVYSQVDRIANKVAWNRSINRALNTLTDIF